MTTPAEIADSHLVLEGVDPDLQGKPQRFFIFLRALPRGEGPCRLTWLGESIHEGGAEGVRGSAVLTLTAILERATAEALASKEAVSTELAQLRDLYREHEQVRDERDSFQRDLEEIGRVIGCGHLADGLARCVRSEIERLQDLVNGLAARVAGQAEVIAQRAEKGATP